MRRIAIGLLLWCTPSVWAALPWSGEIDRLRSEHERATGLEIQTWEAGTPPDVEAAERTIFVRPEGRGLQIWATRDCLVDFGGVDAFESVERELKRIPPDSGMLRLLEALQSPVLGARPAESGVLGRAPGGSSLGVRILWGIAQALLWVSVGILGFAWIRLARAREILHSATQWTSIPVARQRLEEWKLRKTAAVRSGKTYEIGGNP